jgi:salicylate hydroxylase
MQRAPRIAIVGLGLGGLATAIALRQRGFELALFEQAPELAELGAGINITPNATKVFRALGLEERLRAIAFEPRGFKWRDWGDGHIQHQLALDRPESRYGARYYIVHRGDLHRMMSDELPGDLIRLGMRCETVEPRAGGVGLRFAGGETFEADAVIGCDGIRSRVRASVFGGAGPRYAGTMCWRALIPTEALPPRHHDEHVSHWNGPGGFVMSYYVRQGSFLNVVAVRPNAHWTDESWSVPSSTEELLDAFPNVGGQLREILGHADQCTKWGHFAGIYAERWVKGRVALLGDAAHAMLPSFAQGANMAFEDSYVLARWLEAHPDDLDAALAGYESVRQPRAGRVQDMSRLEMGFKKLGSFWERTRREFAHRRTFGLFTGGVYKWIFGYDPVASWDKP